MITLIIAGLGVWLIIDGIVSMVMYQKQKLQEHMIRIIRVGIGVALIILVIQ